MSSTGICIFLVLLFHFIKVLFYYNLVPTVFHQSLYLFTKFWAQYQYFLQHFKTFHSLKSMKMLCLLQTFQSLGHVWVKVSTWIHFSNPSMNKLKSSGQMHSALSIICSVCLVKGWLLHLRSRCCQTACCHLGPLHLHKHISAISWSQCAAGYKM